MELSKKLKVALDENRMLMLGGQILLGFQLRGAFADGFDNLPPHARYLDAAGLGLIVVVTALLIAPEPYHRIVEEGADSGVFHDLVTDIADLALFPFALAIGLDIFLAAEPVFAATTAIVAGSIAAIVALSLWYGLPRAKRAMTGERERAMTEGQHNERPDTPLHTKIEQLLTEARVILPGAQALFGFQLSIVLTQAFERLPTAARVAHAASIGFVALAVMLLMAPAAYHRIVYAGEDTEDMQRTGGLLVTLATLPLAVGLAIDIYVVIAKIAGDIAGIAAGIGGIILLGGLWYGFPLATLYWRQRGAAPAAKAAGQSR